ncbi:unnamed protein product [Urochloa decumbens]|uniref:Uncharacterized protein n=1 Tax=Urochloa decumbens TaxID=240449 RepID=A0ABC9E285_9POAL
MASGQTCTVRSEAGDVLEKVTRINGELACERGNEAALESLRQLQAVPMTFEALEATKEKSQSAGPNSSSAGSRPVTTPRPSVVEAKLETTAMPAIVKKQRSIRLVIKKAEQRPDVVQHPAVLQTAVTPDPTQTPVLKSRPSGSNQKSSVSTVAANLQGPGVAKRVSPATSAASLTTKAKPPAALPKPPSGSGACKRKQAPQTMAFDEARLARAKMWLHEGYKEASTLKEKRKIQVIAAPGKGRPRPIQVRCTAAGGTGKRPPVPSCPRMSRAA